MARSVLILDKYRSTRAKLKSFIGAELSDTVVHEADNVDDGMRILTQEEVHSLIVDDRLPGLERILCKRLKEPPTRSLFHVGVPSLLVLTSSPRQATLERYREQGFEHFLPTPYTPENLASKIDALCAPRLLRNYRRYHLDGTRTMLLGNGSAIAGTLINFSRNGVLCESSLTPPAGGDGSENLLVELISNLPLLRLSLLLPPDYRDIQVSNLPCRLVGMKVLSWLEDQRPERVRLELNIPESATASMEVLEVAIANREKAADNTPLN